MAHERATPEDGRHRGRDLWLLVHASIIATTGSLPVFLLAAVAALARAEIDFGEDQLGVAVTVFFGSAAISATWGGAFVQRIRSTAALRLGAFGSSLALLGLAAVTRWIHIVIALTVAGVSHAICQVASSLRLADHVTGSRMGLAFGIKQSAIPASTLLAGLGLPLVAVTLGWRAVFVVAAAIGLGAAVFQPRVQERPREPSARRSMTGRRSRGKAELNRYALMILSAAVAFTAAGATAMGAFIVEYATFLGIDTAVAGSILVAASAAGITTRVVLGWVADRRRFDHLLVVGLLMGGGSVFVFAFALADVWWTVLIAATLAYMLGWGWPGLFQFAVVTASPAAPAVASGITLAGVFVGGTLGPFLFGWVVVNFSYAAAWTFDFVLLVVGSLLIFWGRHALTRPRRATA